MFAMWFFLSLYLQQVLGYSPVVTGLTFLPQTAAIAIGATLSAVGWRPGSGRATSSCSARCLAAAGLFWLSFIQAGDSYWTGACGGGILATFGMGLAFTPIALLATGGVPHEEAGLASGLVNCSRQIGASVGLAALTTLAASRTAALLAHPAAAPHRGGDAVAVAMTSGYARAFLIASVVVLVGGLLGLVIPPPRAPGAGATGGDRSVGGTARRRGLNARLGRRRAAAAGARRRDLGHSLRWSTTSSSAANAVSERAEPDPPDQDDDGGERPVEGPVVPQFVGHQQGVHELEHRPAHAGDDGPPPQRAAPVGHGQDDGESGPEHGDVHAERTGESDQRGGRAEPAEAADAGEDAAGDEADAEDDEESDGPGQPPPERGQSPPGGRPTPSAIRIWALRLSRRQP